MPGEAGGWMFCEGETTIHLSISYLLSNLDPRPSEWANHFWRLHPPASNSFLLYVLTVHIDTKPKGCSHWPLKHNSQGAVGRTGPSQQPGWMLRLRHGPADLPCSGSPPLLFWLETYSPQLCFIRLKQNSLSFAKGCVQFCFFAVELVCLSLSCPDWRKLPWGCCLRAWGQDNLKPTVSALLHSLSLTQFLEEHYICTFYSSPFQVPLFFILSLQPLQSCLAWHFTDGQVILQTLLGLFLISLHKSQVLWPKTTAEIIRAIPPGETTFQPVACLLVL